MKTEEIKTLKETYAGDSKKVMLGFTGQVVTAPLDTPAPEGVEKTWHEASELWTRIGWITEDGVEVGHEDDSEEIKAWQSGAIIATIIKSSKYTFKFDAAENNDLVLSIFYKNPQTDTMEDGSIKRAIGTPGADKRAFGLDVVYDNKITRYVIPIGELTERDAITYKSDELVKYTLNLTALAGLDGTAFYRYDRMGGKTELKNYKKKN